MLLKYDLQPDLIPGPTDHFGLSSKGDGPAKAHIRGSALLEASRLTGDPEFSLKLGQQVKVTHFGAIGFAIMSCDNLGDVLRLLVRYHPLLDLGSRWQLTKNEKYTTLTMIWPTLPPEVIRALVEATYSSLATLGKDLLGKPITEITVHVSYLAPGHAKQYKKYLFSRTRFSQQDCEIIFPNQLLERSLQTANPAGHVVFRQQCENLLQGFNEHENVSATVRRLVMQAGRRGHDITWVANELAYSERTLRRRLSAEGTSFRSICDEVRNILSTNYLSTTQLTVAEIAELLNYTDPASFRRAFKRLNGLTPQEFRDRATNGL
ncbi:MAG: AraC family transcriptional regulator ligand-binding domain-containing protein [Luminiphilus sp.]|nr:AraC family transcriptional regulator ligand-binding domain-containing protein [Luminiphilus sp.]